MTQCTDMPNTAERRQRARELAVAARQQRFLKTFAVSANITRAARAAKVGRTQVYAWQESSDEFTLAMREAREEAYDRLEQEAVRRAMAGSDTLIMFLLKAARPEKFRERSEVKVHVGDDGANQLTDEQLEGIRRILGG
jgi:hypothetical protein